MRGLLARLAAAAGRGPPCKPQLPQHAAVLKHAERPEPTQQRQAARASQPHRAHHQLCCRAGRAQAVIHNVAEHVQPRASAGPQRQLSKHNARRAVGAVCDERQQP
eukprot:359911-Chlamydomonas_euryale.AAC.4